MSSQVLDYAYSFIPIAAGIALMYILGRFNPLKKHVQLVCNNDWHGAHIKDCTDQNPKPDMRLSVTRDLLICNGIKCIGNEAQQKREGFERLGICTPSEFTSMIGRCSPDFEYLRPLMYKDTMFDGLLYRFCSESGTVLLFLAQYKLDPVVIG